MNNLQKKIKELFDNDHNIQNELNTLDTNGLKFDICDIEFSNENEYKIKLEQAKVSKSFISKYSIINLPTLDFSFDSFTIELIEPFELEKQSRSQFTSSTSGFNPSAPNIDEIIEDLYNDFLKEIDTQQNNITDLYDTTINTSLEFLQEAIQKFQNKTDSYIQEYINNIANNKSNIDEVIKNFKSSSTQEKVITFFQDKYYNSLVLKKLSLSKMKTHIDLIRISPWYSFTSVLARVQLILKHYESKSYQYQQLQENKAKIYDELEDIVNIAIANLILDRQELLDNKNLDTKIDLDKYEIFQYCLPLYTQLLKKYSLNFEGM